MSEPETLWLPDRSTLQPSAHSAGELQAGGEDGGTGSTNPVRSLALCQQLDRNQSKNEGRLFICLFLIRARKPRVV